MDEDQKHLLIPLVSIASGFILWTIVILLLIVEGEEIGSVAEWIAAVGAILVGLVAAGFAALAWKESQAANLWARRAALAEERNIGLVEANFAARVNFTLAITSVAEDSHATLALTVDQESPKAWVDHIEIGTYGMGALELEDHRAILETWRTSFEQSLNHFSNRIVAYGSSIDGFWTFGTHDIDPFHPPVTYMLIQYMVFYRVHDHPDAHLHSTAYLNLDTSRSTQPSMHTVWDSSTGETHSD